MHSFLRNTQLTDTSDPFHIVTNTDIYCLKLSTTSLIINPLTLSNLCVFFKTVLIQAEAQLLQNPVFVSLFQKIERMLQPSNCWQNWQINWLLISGRGSLVYQWFEYIYCVYLQSLIVAKRNIRGERITNKKQINEILKYLWVKEVQDSQNELFAASCTRCKGSTLRVWQRSPNSTTLLCFCEFCTQN